MNRTINPHYSCTACIALSTSTEDAGFNRKGGDPSRAPLGSIWLELGIGIDWLDVDVDYELRAQDDENLISAAHKRLGSNQWWLVDVYVVEQAGMQFHSTLFSNSVPKSFGSV